MTFLHESSEILICVLFFRSSLRFFRGLLKGLVIGFLMVFLMGFLVESLWVPCNLKNVYRQPWTEWVFSLVKVKKLPLKETPNLIFDVAQLHIQKQDHKLKSLVI